MLRGGRYTYIAIKMSLQGILYVMLTTACLYLLINHVMVFELFSSLLG